MNTEEGGGGGRGGGRWKADGSSTRLSTVSSRIALLPANVCHVWHTRRAPRRARPLACTAVRVRVRAHTRDRRVHASPVALRARTDLPIARILRVGTHRMSRCRVECKTLTRTRIARDARVADKPRVVRWEKISRVNFCQAKRRAWNL